MGAGRSVRLDMAITGTFAVLALFAALASLSVGPVDIPATDVARALFGAGDPATVAIVQELRLPRTLLALLIGATLALSGAALQGYVRNPLAEPSLLGTSSFAAFGAIVVLYFGVGDALSPALTVAAVGCALLSVLGLLAIAGRDGRVVTLILAGLALSSLGGALVALALNLAPNPYAVVEIAYWMLGSLSDRSFAHVWIALPFLIAAWALLLWDRRALLALSLGEDVAQSLGANLRRLRLRLALGVALGVGAAVAAAGIIGFVGLVVPHLVRPLVGFDPARLLVPSAFAGAALLTLADTAARLVPATVEIKLGVVTALIGVPFFLLLVLRERRGEPAFL
jgi:iron complex transport system permease protein